jgi:hypothetical protein
MTSNRPSRRAEDFDRALSAESGAKLDPTTAALVAVAGALVALPQRPAPAFRDALRTRLMAEAASMATAASAPAAAAAGGSAARGLQHALSKPAMQVATGGLAAAVAITGVGVNTSRSLPGDALYGLKRAAERWQVGLAGGHAAEADALLEHAQTRLDEIRDLLANGSLRRIEAEIAALQAELKSATDRLLAEAKAGSRDAYDRLKAVVLAYQRQLVSLYDNVPVDSRDEVAQALQTLNVARAVLAAVPVPPPATKSPAPVPTTPPPTSHSPSPTSTSTSILPSTPPPTTPSNILPSTPSVTPPPTTLLPTLPVSLPPLVP